MIVYGLATCDTCKKAMKALADEKPTLRDVRADPLSDAEIAEFTAAFGDAIVNRQSTTWRAASDWLRASDATEQIRQQPALMNRPVIRSDRALTLGWDEGTAARHQGPA